MVFNKSIIHKLYLSTLIFFWIIGVVGGLSFTTMGIHDWWLIKKSTQCFLDFIEDNDWEHLSKLQQDVAERLSNDFRQIHKKRTQLVLTNPQIHDPLPPSFILGDIQPSVFSEVYRYSTGRGWIQSSYKLGNGDLWNIFLFSFIGNLVSFLPLVLLVSIRR